MTDALAPLVAAIADAVAARLAAAGEPASRYYSAADPGPLGSGRAFLDAVRRGAFPAFRAGKRVVARRDDVHAWIESRPAATRRRSAEIDDDDAAADLESAGLQLRTTSRAA